MPLEHAAVGTPGFSRNIATEVKAGKPQKQAVAIAYSKARGDAAPTLRQAVAKEEKLRADLRKAKSDHKGDDPDADPKVMRLERELRIAINERHEAEDRESKARGDRLDSIQSLADELFCKADSVACGIKTEEPKGEAIVGRKADAGERTVKKSVLEQKLRDGTWEMVWEPDRNGRATVKINGKQQTVRIADSAVADRARPSAEVLKEMKAAERDLARLRETGDTPMAQRLALRKVHALEDEYMEAVHMERRGARVDASVSSMSGAQLTRHGEELAREKKRLTEKLRGAKSKGDEDRIKSELAALRKQIDEWHRETMRGDAGGSEWIVEGKRNSGESRRVKMIVTASSEREARDKAHQKGWDITYSAIRKDSSRGDAFGKDDPRKYLFATKASKPKDLGGGKKLVGGVVMKPKPKIDQRKYDEITRKMQALENSGKPYEAVEKEYEKLSRERDRVSRGDSAKGSTIDSLISDAEQLFGRADAVQTGRWEGVADSAQEWIVLNNGMTSGQAGTRHKSEAEAKARAAELRRILKKDNRDYSRVTVERV